MNYNLLFFIFFFNRAMMGPISRNAINHLISGNQRATILSIKNLFMRLFFCSIGPYIGSIVDHKNSNEAFLQCFYIFGIVGLILLLITVKSINKKPQSNLTPSENWFNKHTKIAPEEKKSPKMKNSSHKSLFFWYFKYWKPVSMFCHIISLF